MQSNPILGGCGLLILVSLFSIRDASAEQLEQPPPQETRGSFILFQPSSRTLTIPERSASELTSQWQLWISSTANPSLDNEVPLETAGLILQVGVDQDQDNRWCQIAFRYFTGQTSSDQRRLYPVNFQLRYPAGTTGTFRYWRTVWIPILPQESLSVEKWFSSAGKTHPKAKFLGYAHGTRDESP